MTNSKTCRLCLSTNDDNYLNIFSDFGVEMKIHDIISEHFKCDISELDPLPKFVCHICWATTDAFHELYLKSRAVSEKFLNPLVKIETEFCAPWPTNRETNFIEEQVEGRPIKLELDLDAEPEPDEDSDANNAPINYDSDADFDESNGHNETTNHDAEFEIVEKSPKNKKSPGGRKQKLIEFNKLFAENRHRFDLSCDSCTQTFNSLDEARKHYANEHKNTRGYIKCCRYKLRFPSQVVLHLTRHLQPQKFKCTECGKAYSSQSEFNRHNKKHTEKEITLPCNVCQKVFSSNSTLLRHQQLHEERNETAGGQHEKFMADHFDMKCEQCDTVFTAFHDARRHYKKIHNYENGYIKCCNIKLYRACVVKDHIASHLNPEYLRCDVCSKTFTTRLILAQHRRRIHLTKTNTYTCDYCNKLFRYKGAILQHLFAKHVNLPRDYECEICHKKFKMPVLLKNHMYAVHREKKRSVTCEKCGKSFICKFHLDKHMLSHTDKFERLSQKKQCEHCGEWLLTKSGIFYHQQIHTSGVQTCVHCQTEFPHKPALLAHIRQYHRERKFKCSYCDKSYDIASKLKEHEESHTRHKVYACPFCTRTFTVQSSRQTHVKRNHPEELKRRHEMRKELKLPVKCVFG